MFLLLHSPALRAAQKNGQLRRSTAVRPKGSGVCGLGGGPTESPDSALSRLVQQLHPPGPRSWRHCGSFFGKGVVLVP